MSDVGGTGKVERLPQDVWVEGGVSSGVDLSGFTGTVNDHARAHASALGGGGFQDRVAACWGLIARGRDSLGWVRAGLASGQADWVQDAAGVLGWIGARQADVMALRPLLKSLPDGEAADVVAMVIDAVTGPEPGVEPPPSSQLLLNGAYDRFTQTIRFLEAPFDTVVEEAIAWLSGLGGRSFTPLRGTLPELLDELEPWAMPSWKAMIVRTDSDWTAVFDQTGEQGNYIHEVVGERLGVSRLDTSYSPHVVRNRQIINYGGCAFWYTAGDGAHRSLQASYQSRWDWDASGEPLPFEDQTLYTFKRIVDRLTLDTLNTYCRALGIRRNDPAYYRDEALLVEQDHSTWQPSRTLTAEEWAHLHR